MLPKFTLLFLVLLPFFLSQCNLSNNTNSDTQNSSELVLSLKLSYSLSHGWGHVYLGIVEKVIKGDLKQDSIALHITISDFDSLNSQGLSTINKQNSLIASFNQIENDKPYVNFKNAFIDQEKRTWLLASLEQPES